MPALSKAHVYVAALMSVAIVAMSVCANAVPLRLRGGSRAEGGVVVSDEGLELRGVLTDEAGQPIGSASVGVRIVAPGPPRTALALPEGRACPAFGSTRTPVLASADRYAVETNERGEWCVATPRLDAHGALEISFAGGELNDGVTTDSPIDLGRARDAKTLLKLDARDGVIDLDASSVAIQAELSIDRGDSRRFAIDRSTSREGLTIALLDEKDRVLSTVTTGGDGRALFDIPTTSFGPPGLGELRARFEGAGSLASATTSVAIVRRAAATLALPHPIAPGAPEDGVPIDVDVRSSRGPVPDGVVEAMLGDTSVGAASVNEGQAHLVATFAPGRNESAELTLRYVPAAPWWKAGGELRALVPIEGPSPLRDVLLGCGVIAVAAWIVAGWRRAPKPRMASEDGATLGPLSGRAGVAIVRTSGASTGWSGTVIDAHEGSPIGGAKLSILVPTFEGDGVATSTITDEHGAFSLDASPRSDARLVVVSERHSSFAQALPPPSVIRVALITRRRALLDGLVRWARREGAPFDGAPEPTPGHVRRVATRGRETEVAQWAARVEDAAFGSDPVDASLEDRVRADEPRTRNSINRP